MAHTFKIVNGVKVDLTDAEKAAFEARDTEYANSAFTRAIATLRAVRNEKLLACDWMASSDVTMTDAWKTYRQQLRDLPSGLTTESAVNAVTWPTEPSWKER